MIGKKVLVLTNFTEQTNHARLSFEKRLLENAGYSVDVFLGNKKGKLLITNFLEMVLLKFINLSVLLQLFRQKNNYDIYFFYGVHTLNTLLFFSSKFKKKCIYQTLNHDVEYQVYELKIRIKGFEYFSESIKKLGLRMENSIANSCGKIIVNSQSLKHMFPNAVLIYYSSPLEGVNMNPSALKPYALLYLGQLRKEKIAPDFFTYIENRSIMFFSLGMIKDDYIADQMKSSRLCEHLGDFAIKELKTKIASLGEKWNLLGVSLIQEPHDSYKNQNANKDIDYLALGIPVLGNYRNTTREIIEDGNGYFYDQLDISMLSYEDYSKKTENCKLNYFKYSNDQFKTNFLNVFDEVLKFTKNP